MSDIDDIEDKLKQLDQINSIINGMKNGCSEEERKRYTVWGYFFQLHFNHLKTKNKPQKQKRPINLSRVKKRQLVSIHQE